MIFTHLEPCCSGTFSFIGWDKIFLLCKIGLLPMNALVWISISCVLISRLFGNRDTIKGFTDSSDLYVGSLSFLCRLNKAFYTFKYFRRILNPRKFVQLIKAFHCFLSDGTNVRIVHPLGLIDTLYFL